MTRPLRRCLGPEQINQRLARASRAGLKHQESKQTALFAPCDRYALAMADNAQPTKQMDATRSLWFGRCVHTLVTSNISTFQRFNVQVADVFVQAGRISVQRLEHY